MNEPVIVTVDDVLNEPVYVKPLTKVQRTRKAKNKVAKQSRKKNR